MQRRVLGLIINIIFNIIDVFGVIFEVTNYARISYDSHFNNLYNNKKNDLQN